MTKRSIPNFNRGHTGFIVWRGLIRETAELLADGRPPRSLYAYGIAINWLFIGVIICKRSQDKALERAK